MSPDCSLNAKPRAQMPSVCSFSSLASHRRIRFLFCSMATNTSIDRSHGLSRYGEESLGNNRPLGTFAAHSWSLDYCWKAELGAGAK